MKSEDYLVNAILALSVVIVVILLAVLSNKIEDLMDNVKDLQHRIDLIELYNFEHSELK